ncbi:MAG: chemotaxis protein CheD [Lentisphaerae bacterium]|nr:MAG: chemotaxis protein CheD [Lentisphaerota bacterium]
MGNIILGVGDLGASKNKDDVIKTFGLGSCIAVVFLDPKTRTAGMDHIALPDSSIDPEKARKKPGYFADTGIPALLKEMANFGCNSMGKGFIVKLIGGSAMLQSGSTFDIGKRNHIAIRKILWQYGLAPVAEDVGGTISRTVEVDLSRGRVIVTSPQREKCFV